MPVFAPMQIHKITDEISQRLDKLRWKLLSLRNSIVAMTANACLLGVWLAISSPLQCKADASKLDTPGVWQAANPSLARF